MTSHGGKRNRSGPAPSESSTRSDQRGYSLQALPAEGYSGRAPRFPLMRRRVMVWRVEEGARFQVVDEDATDAIAKREAALWRWLWKTPQACAWSLPSEAWRLHTIALYVRTFVVCESSEATAADKNSLHRFADQIGMTTAGLAEMGWKVAVDVVGEKRSEKAEAEEPAPKRGRRLRDVSAPGAS